ncbi:uncharacterized protein LOC131996610 [Stomoxys calcitrans]|uniref:uncharacterized protein LOC131996610 n=1 Tax=Stomoxys calcitrans TaxID=35570 RepID=UPI0027E39BFA|nr:uncharacterized protein LOC131996610 [Stomoxys calcitrans]
MIVEPKTTQSALKQIKEVFGTIHTKSFPLGTQPWIGMPGQKPVCQPAVVDTCVTSWSETSKILVPNMLRCLAKGTILFPHLVTEGEIALQYHLYIYGCVPASILSACRVSTPHSFAVNALANSTKKEVGNILIVIGSRAVGTLIWTSERQIISSK